SASCLHATSIREIRTAGLKRRYTVTPCSFRRSMYAPHARNESIFGAGAAQPSRAIEIPLKAVSNRCAATSLTFHFDETVNFSQASKESERNNSSSIPSTLGKRWTMKIKYNGSTLSITKYIAIQELYT